VNAIDLTVDARSTPWAMVSSYDGASEGGSRGGY
jgi:hypothetical protein